ncbi:DUF445 family protein [Allofrancisella guangzhouensis]|uniref:DUF445 domain-containing protein n=1 Tax=Allofrancisella guangzhouensis TaxID=594679 RepID=A0A0A8E3Q2_9GAMM|nr:DUF445 family protein [Allofrancisella guangzhouensis]AJC48865.1 hypothetical protein SD28_04090 [Allofrancisella guangzhouensis]MBK2026941.1 DUF445 family protein [Allofrancisella guangzhouensis]MBK2043629.1 DUF445 family protein [Allofrancisella guangzhouensis]MBK2045973.1 DUF445 family protein [Allofrancisella guangzhouensis]
MFLINKSFITNLISFLIILLGLYFTNQHIENIGFYALSGALTNWIAIYMLFEKIPFLYGSGIIPNKFDSFKRAIKKMIMEQFFSEKNLQKFLASDDLKKYLQNILKNKIDYNTIFDSFVEMLMNSKYGSMIEMFLGGKSALENLREPFISKFDLKISQLVAEIHIDEKNISGQITTEIEKIIDARLNELTPQMVKEIIQKIIREHLGWLVVWGGVFGGMIGLIASFIS